MLYTQLETQVRYMKSELESLFWDRKALQRRLQSAIKEHKMMELILEDFEAEHDKAVAKIELLRDEVWILPASLARLFKNSPNPACLSDVQISIMKFFNM